MDSIKEFLSEHQKVIAIALAIILVILIIIMIYNLHGTGAPLP